MVNQKKQIDNSTLEIQTELVTPDVIYQTDKAAIDTQVSTARRFPRNLLSAVEEISALVSMDMQTAKECGYAVPRAGKVITGPSVHLAKIVAQSWGNIRSSSRVVSIDDKTLTSEAVCWDLEKNIAIQVSVKRSIMTKTGRMNNDMITVTGNAANSIALRNAIFAVVPKAVWSKGYAVAQKTITGDLSTEEKLIAKRKQVVQKLIDVYKVTEEEVLSSIGKQSVSHINADDIVVLTGIGQAIKDGDTTVKQAFKRPVSKGAVDHEKLSNKKEAARLEKTLESIESEKDYLELKKKLSGKKHLKKVFENFESKQREANGTQQD